jgi:DNA-binding transcriptional regulator YhcF (GntR family)
MYLSRKGGECLELSFDNLKFNEKDPVYLQIIRYVKVQIHLGHLKSGDEVPSRRILAATLGINPATVQKAYHILEEEGLLVTPANTRSEIALEEGVLEKIKRELTEEEVREFLIKVKNINLSFKDVIGLVSELWDET